MSYQRPSEVEWQWQDEQGKQHLVRWFKAPGTLIWSAWVDRPDGPQYEDGIRQQTADFIERGAPASLNPPDDLLDDLRRSLMQRAKEPGDGSASEPRKGRGLFSWLRR